MYGSLTGMPGVQASQALLGERTSDLLMLKYHGIKVLI
jgi:hypothetical protein